MHSNGFRFARRVAVGVAAASLLAACSGDGEVVPSSPAPATDPTASVPVVSTSPAPSGSLTEIAVSPVSADLSFYRSSTEEGLYAVSCTGAGPSLRVDGAVSDLSDGVRAAADGSATVLSFPAGDGGFQFTAGKGSATALVRVRCLPADFPRLIVDGEFSDWMTLASVGPSAPYEIVLDPSGFPAWFQRVGASLVDFYVDNGDLITFSPEARSHWGFNTDPGRGFLRMAFDGTVKESWVVSDPQMPIDQHAVSLMPNGNVLTLVYERVERSYVPSSMVVIPNYVPEGSLPCPENPDFASTPMVRGRLVEVAPSGEIVNRWNIEEFLPESPVLATYVNVASTVPGGLDCVLDPDHLNTVVFYQSPDAAPGIGQVMLMGRHNNAAILIDWPSGEVVWSFGGAAGEHALTVVDDPYGGLVIPHDAHFIAADLVLVYDNRYTEPSRAAIYRIDLQSRTAALVSSAEVPCGESSCFADAMGSSRVTLDGKGLLIGSGTGTTTAVEYPFDGERIGSEPRAQLVLEGGVAYRVLPARSLDALELFEAQSVLQSKR